MDSNPLLLGLIDKQEGQATQTMTSVGTGTCVFKPAERINIQQLCIFTLLNAYYTILSDTLLRRAAVLPHWVIHEVPTREKGSYQDFGDETKILVMEVLQVYRSRCNCFGVWNNATGIPP